MLHRRSFLLCAASAASALPEATDDLGAQYVKAVLATGLHDPDYVDAYYGPAAWKEYAALEKLGISAIRRNAEALLTRLERMPVSRSDEMFLLRHRFLSVQTRSLTRRLEMLEGRRFSFDEESKALYDVVPPLVPESRIERDLAEIEGMIPGSGPLASRYDKWQEQFDIPAARLEAVFTSAINAARARTRKHIRLPKHESFQVEYVKGQVWSAYNWYKGKAHSLIQINTDVPLGVGAAMHLAAHEGYPGHHVYNALLEDRLVVRRGWLEYSVYPLFSPQSLMSEGTAEHGLDLVFPESERTAFYEQVLFPAAGFDPKDAGDYSRAFTAVNRLKYAAREAARRYLDGTINRDACREFLVRYALLSPDLALQSVSFIEKWRAYIINYSLGKDLVRDFLARRGGGWPEFEKLISSPRLPSGLV